MKNKNRLFMLLGLATLLTIPSSLVNVNNQTVAKAANEYEGIVKVVRSEQSYIDNYYSSISSSLTGDALAYALEKVILADQKGKFSYGSLQTSAFKYTDVDPARPYEGYITSFYSGKTVKGYSGMNKEHTWPNSHGGNKIENDPHVIRPTLTSENSARGNMYFAESSSNGWDPGSFGQPTYRGAAARIALYGAVAGKTKGLILEDVGRGQGSGTGNKMGKLGDLIEWNLKYPVLQSEIIRNETLDLSLNWSRNPFIDDPSYACRIYSNVNTSIKNICANYSVEPTSISINQKDVKINMGDTLALSVSVLPENASNAVNWTSSNTAVVKVSSSGVLTPVAKGTSVVSVVSQRNSSLKDQVNVAVTDDPIAVKGVSLTPTTLKIAVGGSAKLTSNITPANATNKNVTYKVSDEKIINVDSAGLVTAKALGNATVTVTTVDGNFRATSTINVVEKLVEEKFTGKFYNTAGNNGGSVADTTATNLNNGKSEIAGFKVPVVKEVKANVQTYFGRSGGIAIGSSSNPGTFTFSLNDDYKTSKIEVLMNNAGVAGTTISVTGTSGVKITKSVDGTIGTNGSNPSSGTPFVVEFAQPVDEITIQTSKRTSLVEINLFIGDTMPIDPVNPIDPSEPIDPSQPGQNEDPVSEQIRAELTPFVDYLMAEQRDEEACEVKYGEAKQLFNGLSSEARTVFLNHSDYLNQRARYTNWALANGAVINNEGVIVEANYIPVTKQQSLDISIIILVVLLTSAVLLRVSVQIKTKKFN